MKPLIGTDLKRFLRDYRRAHPPPRRLAAILQSVAYPANVSAAFRLAEATAMSEMVLCGITPVPPHPSLDKVARFKADRVPWRHEEDATVAVVQMQAAGYRVVAVELAQGAIPYVEYDFPAQVCLVVGNEDHGVTRATLAACDGAVFLPMYGKGRSLNVSVALSIVAYHVLHAPGPRESD
jgi:tRNA (guanosine-2'-O-)-methyltransferase